MDFAKSIRRHQIIASALVTGLALGVGSWGTFASLSGAVIAPGNVVVEGNSRKLQHHEGGIVTEVKVRNGDVVPAGAVLLRLDTTDVKANLKITLSQIIEIEARRARLICERDGCERLEHEPLAEQAERVWTSQEKLLKARRDVRSGKKQQLGERIAQLEQGIAGLSAQAVSSGRQRDLANQELAALYRLKEGNLVSLNRMLTLEREQERLNGETDRLQAEIARTRMQIGETHLQLIEIEQTTLSEVLAELREVESKHAELTEKAHALRIKLERMTVIAPERGMIHNLAMTATGGIVKAGDTIAEIVPQNEELLIEARVEAGMIDRITIGQQAHARLTSLNERTTPELIGLVSMISADANQDTRGGPSYYVVQIQLLLGQQTLLQGLVLKPGMPAELHFKTGDRAVFSYLLKPFADQIARAMTER